MPSTHTTGTQPSTWGKSKRRSSCLVADRQGTAPRKDRGRCSKGNEGGAACAGGGFWWCRGTANNRTGARCWGNTTQSTWDATSKGSMKISCTSSLLYSGCDLVPPPRLSSGLQSRCILDDTFVYQHILFFLFLLLCLRSQCYGCCAGLDHCTLRRIRLVGLVSEIKLLRLSYASFAVTGPPRSGTHLWRHVNGSLEPPCRIYSTSAHH